MQAKTPGSFIGCGVNSLIVSVLSKEDQPGNGGQHALVLVDRAAVPPAFPAEHAPRLDFCDGMLDCGADLAEACVEFTLPVFQL
jgi:hypothetical protein